MKKTISQDSILRIKNQCNIKDLISEYLSLSRRGANWVGLCPFHNEKDPSFTVNEEKGFFYCFGCGKTGNVIKFLMEIEGITFQEAIKRLSIRLGIPLETQQYHFHSQGIDEKKELYDINKLSMEYYRKNLLISKIAMEYVLKRGLPEDILKEYNIGYAPDGWNNLLNHLTSKDVPLEKAEKAGVIIKNEKGNHYDRFRNRLIFPILNHNGEVCGFGGRTLGDDKPKYLNSSETLVYKKGSILYGFYQNKDAIRKKGCGFVVEGYMDLLSLVSNGVREVVATLGTAITNEHVKHLRGISREWILVFDGDEAGKNAAIRAIPLFYSLDIRVKVFSLPQGEDPDTFINKYGRKVWEEETSDIPTGVDYLMETGKKLYGDDVEGKLKTISLLIPVLKEISDPVRKSLLISNISQKLSVNEKALWKKIQDLDLKNEINSNKLFFNDKKKVDQRELMLIAFILENTNLIPEFKDMSIEFWISDEDLRKIWHEIEVFYCQNGVCVPLDILCEKYGSEFIRQIQSKKPIYETEDEKRKILNELKVYCKKSHEKAMRNMIIEQLRCSENKRCDVQNLLRNYKELLTD